MAIAKISLHCILNLNRRLRWDAQYPRYTEYTYALNLLSVIAGMQVIVRTEENFCFISDCSNSLNRKLKKFINEQIIIFYIPSNVLSISHQMYFLYPIKCTFYIPSNVLCSSDESLQIKHFKHHTFIDMCSLYTFYLAQSANTEFLLIKTSSLKQIEKMYKCALSWKPGVFRSILKTQTSFVVLYVIYWCSKDQLRKKGGHPSRGVEAQLPCKGLRFIKQSSFFS